MADRGVSGPKIAKLGRYEVVSELGKGAMGVVYLAKDPVIGRMVAIKTIRATGNDEDDTEEFRERFVREAQTAGILSHPNIVTIHDIGEDAETQTSFIAMEYIEGKNLKMLLGEKTKFPFEQISVMIAEIAEALDYAHRKGIIHRDVKPANVIITTDGKVKITDFGIAKIASSNLTTTGQFLGTPNYMSPEQVSGAPVDGRSDLFSLGVVLYELLTSKKPFQGDNLTAISYKIVHEDFTPPADLTPGVPVDFNEIVARAMAKDPWNRYQRGKDLALALYQLKAQLEERKSEEDLGTMVSQAAESIDTLRLGNLSAIAESGAPDPQETPAALPAVGDASGSASRRREGSGAFSKTDSLRPTATIAMGPAPAEPPPPVEPPIVPPAPVPPPFEPPFEPAATGPARPAPTMPVRPLSSKGSPKGKSRVGLYAGLAAVVAIAIGIYFATRSSSPAPEVSGPTASVPAAAPSVAAPPVGAPNAEEVGRQKSLAESKRLFDEGRYEESLAILRTVLDHDPDNAAARQLADQADAAIKGRADEASRTAQIATSLESARKAFASKKWAEAKTRAGEVLLLDAENAEAIKLRDDSTVAVERAAAAEKKKVEAQLAKIRAMPKTPLPVRKAEAQGPAAPPPAPAGSSKATLRLLFDSPIPQGHVMVAINDQILLRQPYNFKKGGLFKSSEGRGTVSANIAVPNGPVTVKVWLSGPGISPAYATASASMLPAETRTLKLDYAGGHLGVRVQ
jgi:eukaryotic-like serine/threonine-protein kinase